MWKACTTGKKPRLVSIIREGVNLDECRLIHTIQSIQYNADLYK